MNRELTAKEARDIVSSVSMKDLLLERVYRSIRNEADNGQRSTHRYVDEFEMHDIEIVIKELQDNGFIVTLRRSGLFFKRVGQFTNILVKW